MIPPPWFPPMAPLVSEGGVRFRAISRSATRLRLEIYASARDADPARILVLEPATHRRGDLWEILAPGTGPGTLYTWAAEGPREQRFDPSRKLLDPHCLAVEGPQRFGRDDTARVFAPRPPRAEVNRDAAFKSIVIAPPAAVSWRRPRREWRDSIVYELHVRGFTRDRASEVAAPGTYAGLAEKAPWLASLGITAVELLPVHEFDECEPRPPGWDRGTDLVNFWGYSPIAWFAPNRRYAADAGRPEGPIEEFRAMVRAFHERGIEVLLDVVFNHTGELDETGTTWNLRGLDDSLYYIEGDVPGRYANWSGCGNSVNANHPLVRPTILQALRWWVHGLGVDGFRFDLATILARDADGVLLADPPLIREIEEDPWLQGVRLIAEPWDAGGGYLVAHWPGGTRWSVWNDRFRDDVRRAWLFDPRFAGALAGRLCGSSDLFGGQHGGPLRSLNFVTAHDGFTLRDVVSYDRRHNLANGEQGRDGNGSEPSHGHGVEGETDDPRILAARERSRRNLLATLLLSQGVPMITAGDEIGRTQEGNNNAWCHDTPLAWFPWKRVAEEAAFLRFARGLIRLRSERAALRRERFLAGRDHDGDGHPDVAWLAPDGAAKHWEREHGLFACRLSGSARETGAERDEPDLLLLVNLTEQARRFRVPADRAWRILADTAAEPPGDWHDATHAPHAAAELLVPSRALLLLTA